MRKRKKHSGSVKFAAVGVGILFLVAVLVMTGLIPGLPRLGIVVPGWEIYTQICAISNGPPATLYTSADQFTFPREVGASNWKFDVDNYTYGVPTIAVSVTGISHIDFSGNVIPVTTPAGSVTYSRWNPSTALYETWYLDQHIYAYYLTIRTIADVAPNGSYWGVPMFTHETLWPYEGYTQTGGGGINNNNFIGQKFQGGVYVKFVIDPWTGVSSHDPPNASYVLDRCWAGVMETRVLEKEHGRVDNEYPAPGVSNPRQPPDSAANVYIAGGIERNDGVNMYEDDGTFGTPAPEVPWDLSITPDIRIKSTVVQYLPIQLGAGAYNTFDGYLNVNGVYPCDVAVMYTVRVDVLQAHEFVLNTNPNPPPKPDWPSDYFGWAQSFWTGVLAGLDPFRMFGPLEPFVWFLFTIGVILLIVFVLLAVFAPWVLPRIFGGVKKLSSTMKDVGKDVKDVRGHKGGKG